LQKRNKYPKKRAWETNCGVKHLLQGSEMQNPQNMDISYQWDRQ